MLNATTGPYSDFDETEPTLLASLVGARRVSNSDDDLKGTLIPIHTVDAKAKNIAEVGLAGINNYVVKTVQG